MGDPVAPLSIDFSTYVLSLASSAMVSIGDIPGPDGETHPVDLDMAKYLIDVLGMLESKTKGNLDEAESKLLSSVTYDLRVKFVDAKNAKGAAKK